MGYDLSQWADRIAHRSDFTTGLIHLTRKAGDLSTLDVLFKILDEKTLVGSTTSSGFIVGQRAAVCLQEAPLYSLAQNLYTEQAYRKENPAARVRYTGVGLQFGKDAIFRMGGRPVVYDITADAKKYLPPDHWWRIVCFD